MGLRSVLIITILLMATSCASRSVLTPADRVANETFRFDCCDPGLGEGTKDMCRQAIKNPAHVLYDTDGNRYEFVWSDCEIGKERWRQWD